MKLVFTKNIPYALGQTLYSYFQNVADFHKQNEKKKQLPVVTARVVNLKMDGVFIFTCTMMGWNQSLTDTYLATDFCSFIFFSETQKSNL